MYYGSIDCHFAVANSDADLCISLPPAFYARLLEVLRPPGSADPGELDKAVAVHVLTTIDRTIADRDGIFTSRKLALSRVPVLRFIAR